MGEFKYTLGVLKAYKKPSPIQSLVISINQKPDHVAIIMDGNRRWAKKKSLDPFKGHERGEETVEEVLEQALQMGIKYTTMWALSLDNVEKRSEREIEHLMDLFENNFKEIKDDERIHENKVKINVLGLWRETLPQRVVEAIEGAMEATEDYSEHYLNLLVSYSGKVEMLEAFKGMVEEARSSEVKVTPEKIKENLYTSDLPPVDLMIRTGGEPHNSAGFMMWDVADSQFYFSEKLWPDFTAEDFEKAVQDYARRERRFGR